MQEANATELTKCKQRLFSKLLLLKKCGILKQSLIHSTEYGQSKYPVHDNILMNTYPQSFESLEFYGDSVLQHEVSKSIVSTKQFLSPHLLTQMRTHAVSNCTLSIVYQSLSLEQLMIHPYNYDNIQNIKKQEKERADCIEAMVGEMAQYVNMGTTTVLQNTCQQTLREFISYITYAGEISYYNEWLSPVSTPSPPSTTNSPPPPTSVFSPSTFQTPEHNVNPNVQRKKKPKTNVTPQSIVKPPSSQQTSQKPPPYTEHPVIQHLVSPAEILKKTK